MLSGIALALLIGVGALRLLRPDTTAAPAAGCTPAPGEWQAQVIGVTGDYRQPCGEFPPPPPEAGFPAVVRYNNFGLNDRDLTLEKPSGTFRIVIVGDSFPQGLQVEREQGFPWLLEELLNSESSQPIEVINLSVDAYGTDRELLLYATLGWQFQPDLVLLSIYTGNDIQDNQIDLEHRRYGYRLNRPYFMLMDGQLRLHHSPTYDPAAYPNAPVWRWLTELQAAQLPPTPENPPPRPAVVRASPYTLEYPVEIGLYLPEDAYWSDAWALTEALLRQFRNVVEQTEGGLFAAVIIPDRRVVHGDDWAALLDQYGNLLPALRQADPLAPAARLEAILSTETIPTLNLTWMLRAEADSIGERLYYPGDGHFNARGHLVTARRIALWLRGRGLVP
ncbi:MAG: hypothetical protein HZC41_23805 [Chloroflexi bacterium]|nr:hypothetical protein [Chloroflexota bacterium]